MHVYLPTGDSEDPRLTPLAAITNLRLQGLVESGIGGLSNISHLCLRATIKGVPHGRNAIGADDQ